MTEVLLKELSNSDIDWMLTTGTREEIASGTTLIRQGEPINALRILLDGALTVSVAQDNDNLLGRAFAALEGDEMPGREIIRLSDGEMVGELPFSQEYLSFTTVKALKNSLVLSIPLQRLTAKLQEDRHFAAHLYRAIAILLADRLERIINHLGQSTIVLSQPQLKEILFIFAELHDSDIDWLIFAGQGQQIDAGTVLIQADRPIEALYILLDGHMAALVSEDGSNPLARVFSTLTESKPEGRELARLSKGDILGETPFIEARPPSFSVKAIDDSLVLSIPRWRLAAKLLNDVEFAARFYRVLSVLLIDKQQGIVNRLGYGRLSYSTEGQPLDDGFMYDNELNSEMLAQVALAGARFNWMLQKVRGGN